MPFKKVGKDNYVSPSGRHFDQAQVRLWYSNGGKFPGQKSDPAADELARGSQKSKRVPVHPGAAGRVS